jgi:hypothetical protein
MLVMLVVVGGGQPVWCLLFAVGVWPLPLMGCLLGRVLVCGVSLGGLCQRAGRPPAGV